MRDFSRSPDTMYKNRIWSSKHCAWSSCPMAKLNLSFTIHWGSTVWITGNAIRFDRLSCAEPFQASAFGRRFDPSKCVEIIDSDVPSNIHDFAIFWLNLLWENLWKAKHVEQMTAPWQTIDPGSHLLWLTAILNVAGKGEDANDLHHWKAGLGIEFRICSLSTVENPYNSWGWTASFN